MQTENQANLEEKLTWLQCCKVHRGAEGVGIEGKKRRAWLKLSIAFRDFMECGGKRSATPLWLERLVLKWIRHKPKPKRRRASLAAALHTDASLAHLLNITLAI